MNYHVLARKYRPHSFEEMVGQEHALRTLINALDQNRLHHAYLFTGTRGVGKTSLARLLAKCLNCETGVSSHPCNTCSTCQEIDAGRFADLIEVDAASRTKVEDTRELLDNVQYAPVRGRYKIYLIDEVHMLSGHSFNALLKTLEEPPSHVKFLFATTDPQRLPVTILSRCLQFNLKNLSVERIQNHLETILKKENIPYEIAALQHLSRAANGSMRDALSLLDQAIGFGANKVIENDVCQLLGTIERTQVFELISGLIQNDAKQMLVTVRQLDENGADFETVSEDLLHVLHQIAILQNVPEGYDQTIEHLEKLKTFAKQIPREDIQLYYQIALLGKRDLLLAPTPRTGFEMLLLRLLNFKPATITKNTEEKITIAPTPAQPPATAAPKNAPVPVVTQNSSPTNIVTPEKPIEVSSWEKLISQLNLTGFTQALALNCVIQNQTDDLMELLLDPNQNALLNPKQETRLTEAFTKHFGRPVTAKIALGKPEMPTPARLQKQRGQQKVQEVANSLNQDPNFQHLVKTFDAEVKPGSILVKNPDILTPSTIDND